MLCSHPAHLWAIADFVPRSDTVGTPEVLECYVATRPTCGPLLILSSSLKCWGRPRPQGLCSHPVHLQATSDFVPRFEAFGSPPRGKGYVATRPTCGPLLILLSALKHWGTPGRQGLFSHVAHLWATADFVPHYEALGLGLG